MAQKKILGKDTYILIEVQKGLNAIVCSFLQKQTNRLYLALSILTLILLPLFYLIVFLHQRFA
jgi:hypothetical protein